MYLYLVLVFYYQFYSAQALSCTQEQPLCLTVNLTTLLNVCRDFFRVPCPLTCGVCASERLKLKFLNSIDPNSDHRIGIEEAQVFLRNLNVTLDDALVTEIKELIMDSKAILTDMYNIFDVDQNGVLNLTEVFKGYLNMFEFMGVKVKSDFKDSISTIAEMIKISNHGETNLPSLSDLIRIIMEQFDSSPHGLISLNRIQNMTNGFFNLERVVVAQQLVYTVNSKVLTYYLLSFMDLDNDGSVSQPEYTYSVLDALEVFNISLSKKVEENLKSYFDIYHSSVKSIMSKYGVKEAGLLDGVILPEYQNRPFINLVLPIHEAVQSAHKIPPKAAPRYVRTSSNSIPPRKLTALSIIEAIFGSADRNEDGVIDVSEFAFFTVNSLPQDYSLSNMNESLKVLKLFDENNDDRLNPIEFKELFRPRSNVQEILNSVVPAIAQLIK